MAGLQLMLYFLSCSFWAQVPVYGGRFSKTKIVRNETVREAVFYKRFFNSKLVSDSNKIGVMSNTSLANCIRGCLRVETCESLNYNSKATACEIFNITIIEDGIVSRSEGWNHFQPEEKLELPCQLYQTTGRGGDQAWTLYGEQLSEQNVAKYCDQSKDGGGWTMIGKYDKDGQLSESQLLDLLGTELGKLSSGDFLLSLNGLQKLWQVFAIRQIRWSCIIADNGGIVDIATNDDASGDSVTRSAVDPTFPLPSSCDTYYRVPGEYSSLARYCGTWMNGKWFFAVSGQERLYRKPMHSTTKGSIDMWSGQCGVEPHEKVLYQYYVR